MQSWVIGTVVCEVVVNDMSQQYLGGVCNYTDDVIVVTD